MSAAAREANAAAAGRAGTAPGAPPPAAGVHTPPRVTPWRLLSLLLDYPDDALLACGGELRAAARDLPPSEARNAVLAELERRASMDPAAVQREYVATFDFAKRSTLYLSFHVYGDRRQRGMAMLELKRSFRAAGLELLANALPDHLPAVLEFAHAHPEAGAEVLQRFRPALEVVRAALHDEHSPYAPLLDAVCGLLPAASEAELADARRIAAQGPPDEQVGLEPFAPPEVMPPAATPRPTPPATATIERRCGAMPSGEHSAVQCSTEGIARTAPPAPLAEGTR